MSDLTQRFSNGVLIEQWDDATRTYTDHRTDPDTVRPYTAQENADADQRAADAAKAATEAQIEADTTADLTSLRTSIDTLQRLLGDDATSGSIRALIGSTNAAAGTTTLRSLKAQNNTAVVSAASIKALIDRVIDLAQLSIDDVQATRRVARQTLRLAKAMVGDYSSADVGTA